MRRPRLGAAAGTPPPAEQRPLGETSGNSCAQEIRRTSRAANVSRGRTGVRPWPPVDRLSYTITMRSIIPAREALASTDDRPHDPAPAGGAPSAPPCALPPDARLLAARRRGPDASVVTRRASTFSAAGSPSWGRTLLRRL